MQTLLVEEEGKLVQARAIRLNIGSFVADARLRLWRPALVTTPNRAAACR